MITYIWNIVKDDYGPLVRMCAGSRKCLDAFVTYCLDNLKLLSE
jgi:hypothetical protein